MQVRAIQIKGSAGHDRLAEVLALKLRADLPTSSHVLCVLIGWGELQRSLACAGVAPLALQHCNSMHTSV